MIYILIWYAFYDLWPENGVGPILKAPKPIWGKSGEEINNCNIGY